MDLETAKSLFNEIENKDPEIIFNILSLHFLKKPFNPAELRFFYQDLALKVQYTVKQEVKSTAKKIFKLLLQAYEKLKSPANLYSLDSIITLSNLTYGQQNSDREYTQLYVIEELLLLAKIPKRPVPDEQWDKAQAAFDDLVKHLKQKPIKNLLLSERRVIHSVKFFNEVIAQGRARSKGQREELAKTTEMDFFKNNLFPTLTKELKHFCSKVLDSELISANSTISASSTIYGTLASVFNLTPRFEPIENDHIHPHVKYCSRKGCIQYLLEVQKKLQPQIRQFNALIFTVRELKILLKKGIADSEIKKELFNYITQRDSEIQRIEPFSSYPNTYVLPKLSLFNKSSHSQSLILNKIQAFQNIYQAETLKELLVIYKEITEKKGVYASLFEERGFWGLFGKYGATKTSQRCLREVKNRIAELLIYYSNYDKDSFDCAKKVLGTHHGRYWWWGRTTSTKISEKMEREWKETMGF